MPILPDLIQGTKTKFDLTETADQQSLYAPAEKLLEQPLEEVKSAVRQQETPLEFKIAAKLVDARRFLLANQQPVKIGVVFAMWGEQNRLRPKSPDNPNGEDALRVKLAQLAWATAGTAVTWQLYAVDDGDPHDSGALAARIAAGHPLGDQVKVLWRIWLRLTIRARAGRSFMAVCRPSPMGWMR